MCHFIFSFIWHQGWIKLNITEKFVRVNENTSPAGEENKYLKKHFSN
jgi:hypothetical protein